MRTVFLPNMLAVFVFMLSGFGYAFDSPNLSNVTFKQLAAIQAQREGLFPQTEQDLRNSKLFQSIGALERINLPRSTADSSKIAKVASYFGFKAGIDLNQRIKLISATFGDFKGRLASYRALNVDTKADDDYFTNYAALLEDLSARIKDFKEVDEQVKTQLSDATVQLKDYLDFEKSLKPLRQHLKNEPVATIILGQMNKGVKFSEWMSDFLEFGYRFESPISVDDLKGKGAPIAAGFYEKSLASLNNLTRQTQNLETLKKVDAAYRTIFLRLQILNPKADFGYLMQQRQLAKNGMTSILEAYNALLKKMQCAVADALKCTPSLSQVGSLVTGALDWMSNHPLEAEVLTSELQHAFTILTKSGSTDIERALNFVENAYQRRMTTDFTKDLLFGDYERIADPKEALAPELIALTHMAPALPYAASIVSSVKGDNLGSRVAGLAAFAAAFALGGEVPVAAVLCFKIVMGFGQVKLEKALANQLSSRADFGAMLSGVLSFANTGDLKVAMNKAAGIFLARKGVQWIGAAWTDCREGRSTWVEKAVEIGPVVATGVLGSIYSYCTGDMTGINTFGAMACGYGYMKWNNSDKSTTCRRVNDMVAAIASNMDLDPAQIAEESQKLAKNQGSVQGLYDDLVAKISNKSEAKSAKEQAESALETLFSNKPFLPDSLEMMKFAISG